MQMELQIVSYGPMPGTGKLQYMVNANFEDGLFEAFTLTVLVDEVGDEQANRMAAIARANALAGEFCRRSQVRQLPKTRTAGRPPKAAA